MLKLIPPGKRKNKYWVIRGSLDGNKIEQSTGKSLRQDAEVELRKLIKEYERGKKINENVTVSEAIERYSLYRQHKGADRRFLVAIKAAIGERLITDLRSHDLIALANKFYPHAASSTKNRAVITPISAFLKYAARNDWCSPLIIERFPEPKVKPRFVTPEVEQMLLTNTSGDKNLFFLWLFRQGDRLGDVLRMRYEDCDLENEIVHRHISKTDDYVDLPLDPEIATILRKREQRSGLIFPWKDTANTCHWVKMLVRKLGIKFTCHMARHTLGKRLNDSGAGLKTIMQTLGHSDPKSSLRYQTTDIETIRRAKEKAHERCQSVQETSNVVPIKKPA